MNPHLFVATFPDLGWNSRFPWACIRCRSSQCSQQLVLRNLCYKLLTALGNSNIPPFTWYFTLLGFGIINPTPKCLHQLPDLTRICCDLHVSWVYQTLQDYRLGFAKQPP